MRGNRIKINQHYVPRFYLKNFANNNDGKCISGFELKSKKYIRDISIKETASKKYYYGKNGLVEDWFMEFEGIWKRITFNIIENADLPCDLDEYLYLLLFISLSEMRTFKFGNVMNKVFNGAYEHIKQYSDMEKPYDLNEHPTLFMLEHLQENADIYEVLRPLLLINETEYDFLTSDNPCVKYNQFFVSRNLDYYGLRHGGLQIFLPLSPRICLCLYDDEAYKVLNNDSAETIKIINTMQIIELNKLFLRNADLMIYFKDRLNYDDISLIVRDHKFYQHEPFIKTSMPIFGIKMESINDYFDLALFEIRRSFIKDEV